MPVHDTGGLYGFELDLPQTKVYFITMCIIRTYTILV